MFQRLMASPNGRITLRTLTKGLGCFVEMTLGRASLYVLHCCLLPEAQRIKDQTT
jgi:hypothetical protein